MNSTHLEPLPDQTDALCDQILVALQSLRWRTIWAVLGFLGLVAFDAALNWHTVGLSFATEWGVMLNPLIAAAFSLLSVSAWLFVGWLYMAHHHRAALAAYVLVTCIVGFLSAPMSAPFVIERWASVGVMSPNFLQMIFGIGLFTLLLSIPGLLLCLQEQRLATIWKHWRIRGSVIALQEKRSAARAALETRGTVEGNLRQHQAQRERIVNEVVLQVERDIEALREQHAKAAEAAAADVSLSKKERHAAWKRIQRHRDDNDKATMAGGMKLVLLFLLITGSPAWANPVDDLMQKAPTLLILLDATAGSPALEPSMIPQIERAALEQLEHMPLATSVIVFSVGDPKQIPEIKRWRIQSRITQNGGTVSYLKQALHTHLQGFPSRHPEAHKESHLVGGWHDAAQLLNPNAATPNAVLFVTDAMEYSSLANCYRACALPKPTFTLNNTSIEVLGIGFGQSSAKTLAIFQEWKKFFAAAGVPNTQLLHVF